MAEFGKIKCEITLSPELKQELACLRATISLLLERFGEGSDTEGVRVNGEGIDGPLLTITNEEREVLLIKPDPAPRTPYFGSTRAL